MGAADRLLGAADVREIAAGLGLRPTKSRGQNFVIDANTIRRLVRLADLSLSDRVLEVGPGLGSLTLGLLGAAGSVVAVEVDRALADALPGTVEEFAPGYGSRLAVVPGDALARPALPGPAPNVVVANLPYNVAVPVLLDLLAGMPALARGLVMVQLEVADRLVAGPGEREYGGPSVKLAWYAAAARAGLVARTVFWPRPRVDSGLVTFARREPPPTAAQREQVFAVVDAAFAGRRKTLRAALGNRAGSPARAEQVLRSAGIDPGRRAEELSVVEFARIAEAWDGPLAPRRTAG